MKGTKKWAVVDSCTLPFLAKCLEVKSLVDSRPSEGINCAKRAGPVIWHAARALSRQCTAGADQCAEIRTLSASVGWTGLPK